MRLSGCPVRTCRRCDEVLSARRAVCSPAGLHEQRHARVPDMVPGVRRAGARGHQHPGVQRARRSGAAADRGLCPGAVPGLQARDSDDEDRASTWRRASSGSGSWTGPSRPCCGLLLTRACCAARWRPVVFRCSARPSSSRSARTRGWCFQVMPFSAGAHAGLLGEFILLGLPGGRDVAYTESVETPG